MSDEKKEQNDALPAFWRDKHGDDQTSRFNFYRFCQLLEGFNGSELGTGRSIKDDPVRFRPNPRLGFPAGELKRTETDPNNPDAPSTVRTNFLGLYGVDSPLPTAYIDDINQDREGGDAMAAFLDIFNHRLMTQFYRIWKKYSYPATFEDGGTDKISQSLMALTGITNPVGVPASRMLALLQPMLLPTHTADGVKAVICSQAPNTQITVTPRYPVDMPVSKRARLSIDGSMTLDQYPVMGDRISVANYCVGVEMYTEDEDEAKGWMPNGELRRDVFAMLRTYLGVDYDVSLHLTIPTRLLPRPRLGDPNLFSGYNMMLGLTDDNEDQMPKTMRMRVGRMRKVRFDDESDG